MNVCRVTIPPTFVTMTSPLTSASLHETAPIRRPSRYCSPATLPFPSCNELQQRPTV